MAAWTSLAQHEYTTHLKVLTQFLQKTDGKDKLLATIQYACLFISAGEPGNVKKVQASVAAGRKVFRILRPLEVLMPLIQDPTFKMNKPLTPQFFMKLKCLFQAVYFGADHFVWSSQAGLLTDKEKVKRFQKTSLWCWFGASSCTIGAETYQIWDLASETKKGEDAKTWEDKRLAARQEIEKRSLVLCHAIFQALLALGLLEIAPFKPRTVGIFGMIASALNCYMLYPSYPAVPSRTGKAAALPPVPVPGVNKPQLKLA